MVLQTKPSPEDAGSPFMKGTKAGRRIRATKLKIVNSEMRFGQAGSDEVQLRPGEWCSRPEMKKMTEQTKQVDLSLKPKQGG